MNVEKLVSGPVILKKIKSEYMDPGLSHSVDDIVYGILSSRSAFFTNAISQELCLLPNVGHSVDLSAFAERQGPPTWSYRPHPGSQGP